MNKEERKTNSRRRCEWYATSNLVVMTQVHEITWNIQHELTQIGNKVCLEYLKGLIHWSEQHLFSLD